MDRGRRHLLIASYLLVIVSFLLAWWQFRERESLDRLGPAARGPDLAAREPTRHPPAAAPATTGDGAVVATAPPAVATPDDRTARQILLARESGRELRGARVVVNERPALGRSEHPGSFLGLREIGRGDSPLVLPRAFELWDQLAILVPGRAALFVALDARNDCDRRLELEPGIDLALQLEGFAAAELGHERTRVLLRRRDGEILVDRPADLGERFLLENLPTGPAVVTIEAYPIGSRPPLARALVDLAPGSRPELLLSRLPDPPRLPLRGVLALPAVLGDCEWLEACCRRRGGDEDLEVDLSCQRDRDGPRGELTFAAELPAIGDWELVVEGQRFPFEIGGNGREDLRFELAAPAVLVLEFEGDAARRTILRWRAGTTTGLGFLDGEERRQLLNPPPGPVEVEIETDDGIQIETFELPPGGARERITLRPATSFWVGVVFEGHYVMYDMAEALVIDRLDGGSARRRILLEDPFRCRVALAEPGRYLLALRRPPPGFELPEPLVVDLEPGSRAKLAFELRRQR